MNDREEGANNGIGSKWSEIEDDVLAMVLKRLSPIDCLRAQNVCLSWRSTISKLINCENGIPSPEIPLALFNMPKMKHFCSSTCPHKASSVILLIHQQNCFKTRSIALAQLKVG